MQHLQAFPQAQLAVAACLHLKDFALAHFKVHSAISTEDVIYFTYLYARELEHSVPNVLATERFMDEHPLDNICVIGQML